MGTWTRRAFIGAGTLVGGGLALGVAGVALAPSRHSIVEEDAGAGRLTTWILVTPDDEVTILVPHCEMGQGAQTALAMMAAEEMDAAWERVRVQEAPATDVYANAYIGHAAVGDVLPGPLNRAFDYATYRLARRYGTQLTGGSLSVRTTGHYGMRVAGAASREMLVAAAAARWDVPAAECRTAASQVLHPPTKRALSFGALAVDAGRQPVPSRPALKDPATYTLRGTPRARLDLRAKVDGSAVYGIDFTMAGLLHAAVATVPVFGGRLVDVDPTPAERMPGVRKVVRLDEAVAVVADSYWRASRALEALSPTWDDAGREGVSSATLFRDFDAALGAAPEMPAGAARVVTADYRVPFLAHATMEPMACTARVTPERVDLWAGTQDPLNARSTAAGALEIPVERVHVTTLALGGGFGRKLPGSLDFVGMSARIARELSPAPVKMVWSRETDMRRGLYRPAAMSRHAGALDAAGVPIAIASRYVGGGDDESLATPYAIPRQEHEAREVTHHVRTGAWRSVLNSQHGFFKEAFIDELAHAAGRDPFEFRRGLMGERPRFRAVLERAATLAGWGTPLPPGQGRGIAVLECFGSIVAEVAQVAVTPDGALKVQHVYAAVDCGEVVNPDTATAQVEGGIIFGLSAALVGAITIDKGRVVESNFHDHEMIRLADAPRITVEFIRSTAVPGGLGEPAVAPIAAAVTNAIFAACGVRVRALPVKNTSLARASA